MDCYQIKIGVKRTGRNEPVESKLSALFFLSSFAPRILHQGIYVLSTDEHEHKQLTRALVVEAAGSNMFVPAKDGKTNATKIHFCFCLQYYEGQMIKRYKLRKKKILLWIAYSLRL